MAYDAACKDDDLTPEEAAATLEISPDLRGVHRLEFLEVVKQDVLFTGAEEHEAELLVLDDND